MCRGLVKGSMGLVFLVIAGCTKDEDYYRVFREQRANYKEMADILASVKDAESMSTAKASLDEKAKQFEATAEKFKRLPSPPPPQVVERMMEEKAILQSNVDRVKREVERIRTLEGGNAFLRQFASDSPGLFSAVQP